MNVSADRREGWRSAQRRYIVQNMAIWLGVCVLGTAVLVAVRDYGRQFELRRQAAALVADAAMEYDGGSIDQAERVALRAIRLDDGAIPLIVESLGDKLLKMPEVMAAIAKALPLEGRSGPMAEGLYQLLVSNVSAAEQRFSLNPDGSHEAWALARLMLSLGDIPAAAEHFDTYWRQNRGARTSVAVSLKSGAMGEDGMISPAAVLAYVHALFERGLWFEAREALRGATSLRETVPELAFYEGVFEELEGRRDEALKAYGRLLAERPDHLLALRRVHALLSAAQ